MDYLYFDEAYTENEHGDPMFFIYKFTVYSISDKLEKN